MSAGKRGVCDSAGDGLLCVPPSSVTPPPRPYEQVLGVPLVQWLLLGLSLPWTIWPAAALMLGGSAMYVVPSISQASSVGGESDVEVLRQVAKFPSQEVCNRALACMPQLRLD